MRGRLVGVLTLLAFVLSLLLFWDFTVDDSYISHRYAYNYLHHGVWNWDVAAPRVEAYTSALYAALAMIPIGLGWPVDVFFKVFHLGLGLGWWWSLRGYWRRYALLFLVSCWYIPIHVFSGLETWSFMLALVWLAQMLDRPVSFWGWALVWVLPFIRPEGLFFALWGAYVYVRQSSGRQVLSVVLVLGLWLGYFVWRYDYFGYLLPNTFYFKAIQGSSIRYLPRHLLEVAFYALPLALLWRCSPRRFAHEGMLVIAFALGLLLYAPSSLQMNYADRFWIQLFVPLFWVYATGLESQHKAWLIAASLFIWIGTNRNLDEWRRCSHYGAALEQVHIKTGRALAPFADRGYMLLTGDAGALPYFSGWRSVEFVGVANPELTHRGWTDDYLDVLQPDLVVLFSRTAHPSGIFSDHHQDRIWTWLQDQNTHQYITHKTWRNGDTYLYFLRRDLPDFTAIAEALRLSP
ncbi:MAG: hypothetical protein ACFCUI_10195 [Bernardetiaceae bacterium]